MVDRLQHKTYQPPKEWKPTPWFPLPFNKEQLAQLAQLGRLPTFGFLHRPTFIKMTDQHGKPLTRRRAWSRPRAAIRRNWWHCTRPC